MTITHRATVDVFLQAFHSLSKSQRDAFLEQLFHEQTYREDLLDLAMEELEAQNPRFLSSLEAARKSGRVSASAVKRKARLS